MLNLPQQMRSRPNRFPRLASAGPLEVTQKEDTSSQLGGLRRKPQAMVQRWALFASL
jgi:hypothetical protein